MNDNLAAAGGVTATAGLMADGRIAARERAELARLRALLALGQRDASFAQTQIEQMRTLAATLPRRARIEALRSG